MKTNIVIDTSLPICGKILVRNGTKCHGPIKLWDSLKERKLKKEVSNEVYFLHADKHQSFLQFDTIILSVHSQTCSNYPK